MAADKNAQLLDKVGVDSNLLGGKWGALGVTAVASVAALVAGGFGIRHLYNKWKAREEGADPKTKGSKGKRGGKGGSAKLTDKSKTEEQDFNDKVILGVVGVASVLGLVWFLPTISASLGLEGSLGAITGPISAGKDAVLGLVGMGSGPPGLPPP